MIIIGHKNIPFSYIYKCSNIQDIPNTPPNSTILITSGEQMHPTINHCISNNISYSVRANSIQELMIFSALHSTYILVSDIEFAKKAQNIAEHYLFDSKILFLSNNVLDIEKIATLGIDGILLEQNAITNA